MTTPERSDPAAHLYALDERVVQPQVCALGEQACIIGRDPDCTVVIQRTNVSRRHARIDREGERYRLIDLGSSNGTFVNGRRISEPHLLHSEDQISLGLGTALLRFVDPLATFVQTDQLRFDDRLGLFFLHGQALELSPNQIRLLRLLHRNSGQLCTRDACARAIWGEHYDPAIHAGALDQLVTTLRARLRQIDETRDLIKTRRGLGYVLEV